MLKKILIAILKFGISFSILGFLFYRASQDKDFSNLVDQPKQWDLLASALLIAMTAISMTFIRWYWLVRALDLPFTLKDAFRLGFLGFLFSFLTLGVVGGDALKAVFIARQIPGRRTEVVATVVVDRIIGLFALFIVASTAFLFVDLTSISARDPASLLAVRRTCQVAFGLTIAGAVGFAILLLPGATTGSFWEMLTGLPKVGRTIERVIGAMRIYRRNLPLLSVSLVASMCVHALMVLAIFQIARGMPGDQPALGTHFMIVPISMLAGSVPLPGGLGAFELALDVLYRSVSSTSVAEGQGFVIALAFRVITLVIAFIGVIFYFTSRREVTQLMHEAELEEQRSHEDHAERASDGEPTTATATAD